VVGTLSAVDESAEPSRRPDPAVAEVDRLEALELQVRQLTSRLAGWVEAQLVQALEDRRTDMRALRSELQAVVAEQLAGMRAEQASMLAAADHRAAATEEQLAAHVETLAARAETPPAPPGFDSAPLAEVEERVARQLAELHDQVEARISASAERQRADLEALRIELLAVANDASRRPDGLEQRVRAAMSRLSESVESKLAEVGTARQGEVDGLKADTTRALAQQAGELRTEIANAATALRARFTQAQERVEALERKYGEAEAHVDAVVETKLSEVVDRRRVELDQLKWELQEDLAKQLSDARTDIGTTVSDAHRRFLLSIERLEERMATVSDESAALVARLDAVQDGVASDGERIEALELHTRRTDERLTELIEGKLAELAGERIAELEEFRGQLRTALDSHLADTRVEVSMSTGAAREELGKTRQELVAARRELAEGAERLDERQAGLDREVSQAVARLESLGVSVQDRLREAEVRTAAAVAARLTELDPVAAQIDEHRAEVARLAEQFQAVAEATRKAAFAEEGMLAPLRSDVRRLQEQVADLTELLYELRPRRKAPPPAKAGGPALPAVRPVPAEKAPAAKNPAAAKKKAAAPRRRTAQ
jgi:hypothetical protein